MMDSSSAAAAAVPTEFVVHQVRAAPPAAHQAVAAPAPAAANRSSCLCSASTFSARLNQQKAPRQEGQCKIDNTIDEADF